MSTWEERMAAKAAARRPAARRAELGIPAVLAGELPPGMPDTARHWCTSCGLPDVHAAKDGFEAGASCPRCGSPWRWHGRLADRDGTATGPPDDGTCPACCEWRRYPPVQEHFGWAWWRTCANDCACAHHAGETWLA